MDLTTIDDVLKQKKQELKNVKRLILNSHNYVARLLHKRFVENNGCKVCFGLGKFYDKTGKPLGNCICSQEIREKSGIDPYNGVETHFLYQENILHTRPDDYDSILYPVISSDLFKSLTHGLPERVSELRDEIHLLSTHNKYERFDSSLVVVTNPAGADNFFCSRDHTDVKRMVEFGTVLRLNYKTIWHHPWRGHKTRSVTGWGVLTLGEFPCTYFIQQKDFRKLYNQEQTW